MAWRRNHSVDNMGPPCRIERISLDGQKAAVRIYTAAGAAAVPSIIALHGFTGSGLDFLPLREALGSDAWNWICPDFMGHGLSAHPEEESPYSLSCALELVRSARRFVPEGSTPYLLAYSMGGRIALHYLLQDRPLTCAVIGASPGIENSVERTDRIARDEELKRKLRTEGIEAFCNYWESLPIIRPQTTLPEPLRSEVQQRRRLNSSSGLAGALTGLGTGVLPSLWNRLDRLPGLTSLAGEYDDKFKAIADEMARRNPGIRTAEISASGHAPHLEQPEKLARLLESVFSH